MGFFKKKSRWDKFPHSVIETLIMKLGQERVDKIKELSEKYNFFSEKIVNNSLDNFFASFPGYLVEVADHIMSHGMDINDAKFLLLCSVNLNDKMSSTHSSLAMIYYITGRDEEAKGEAKKSLESMPLPKTFELSNKLLEKDNEQDLKKTL